MEFTVERQSDHAPVVHLTFDANEPAATVVDALALAHNVHGDELHSGPPIWLHGTTDERRAIMSARGLISNRTLHQMRRPLPAPSTQLETSAFTPADIEDFVAVNNRAFSWHPEQSGLTADAVRADMAQPWFDSDGFRLHRIDGVLAGFCWTKIHADPEPLGEIYVIAVDPQFHGRGLGKALTLAGLQWLAMHGLTTAMLYVESDNESAVATYENLGFEVHRVDTLWRRR